MTGLRRLALAGAALCAVSVGAVSAELSVIETTAPVREIATVGGVFVTLANGLAYRVDKCRDEPVCLVQVDAVPRPSRAPSGGLSDGGLATARAGDIIRAWYARPTDRYDHGVLGDRIEAGSLVAETRSGRRYELRLPDTHVFEDLTPRIADLDRDGRNEIVAIRSSLARGAAVALYGIRDDALVLLDATPEIGRTHRWLNIAGIADYTGAGVPVVAWVETPHIGGILRMAAFQGGRLDIFQNAYRGFSNHVIGSRNLAMSATGDFTGDGVPDLGIPSADRRELVVAARTGIARIAMPGRIGHAIGAIDGVIVTATEDGHLLAIIVR